MILNEDDNPEQEIFSEQYTSLLKQWVTQTVGK